MFLAFLNIRSLRRILSLILLCCIYANVRGQEVQKDSAVTINLENVSLLQILNQLEKETGYSFGFSDDIINNTKRFNVHYNKASLRFILNDLSSQAGFDYKFTEGKNISIKSKDVRKIKGKITDAKSGEPLVGAVVMIRRSDPPIAVISDIDGDYEISVKESDEIEIRYLGYSTKVLKPDDKEMSVSLDIEPTNLDPVVYVGYGQIKKSDATGSVAVVSNEDLIKVPAVSADAAIQGRVPGVMVSASSGMPGSSPTVKIRGIGSINSSSEPLFVIDGNPVDNSFNVGGMNPLASIPPEDIQNITVLKDASATAIYGARGANGVIQITTKRGDFGERKIKVSFSTYAGFSAFPKQLPIMNADQYSSYIKVLHNGDPKATEFVSDVVRDQNAQPQWYPGNGRINTDWQKMMTRSHAPMHNYNLTLDGSSSHIRFNTALNYYDEEGTIINSNAKRFSFRNNSDYRISKWLNAGQSLSISYSRSFSGNMLLKEALKANPLMPVYNDHNRGGYQGPEPQYNGINDVTNPVAEAMLNTSGTKGIRLLSNVYTEITPPFIKGLKYRFEVGNDIISNNTRSFVPIYELPSLGDRSHNVNTLYQGNDFNNRWRINNSIMYDAAFGPKDEINNSRPHRLSFLMGYECMANRNESFGAKGQGFEDERIQVMDQAQEVIKVPGSSVEYRMASYLWRAVYDYKSKYLLTANLRNDWSSLFGPENRSGWFPSFAAAWKWNEDFLQDYKDVITMAKLRIGWGQTGNANITPFAYADHFDRPSNVRYPFGTGNIGDPSMLYGTAIYSSGSNAYLHWEAASMTNVGTDFSFFDNQLQFTAEYYIKNQHGMLVLQPMTLEYGRLTGIANPWVNLGDIQNRGFEFDASYIKRIGDFGFKLGGNFTTIKNKVIKLPNGDVFAGSNSNSAGITTPGHTIGSFYGFIAEGIFQNQTEVDEHAVQPGAKPGDIRFKDLNGDRIIDDNDRTIIGKPVPDFIYGMNLSCSYKGFDVSVFLQGVQNVQIYNQTRAEMLGPLNYGDFNKLSDIMNYWTPENHSTTIPRLDLTDANNNDRISTFWLENGSYLRVKNIQIGYSISEKWLKKIKISVFRIYLSATNVYTITKYKGYDPELPSGTILANYDMSYYPVPKVYNMGLQVQF